MDHPDPDKLDNGYNYYYPAQYPITIYVKDSILDERVERAVNWWHLKLNESFYRYCEDHNVEFYPLPPLLQVIDSPVARVLIEYYELEEPTIGTANSFVLSDGKIVRSRIRIDPDSEDFSVVVHELGHGAFGLADDSPDQPESIMCIINQPRGELSPRDAYLVLQDFGVFDYLPPKNP
jgi:hypothetical protein